MSSPLVGDVSVEKRLPKYETFHLSGSRLAVLAWAQYPLLGYDPLALVLYELCLVGRGVQYMQMLELIV